MPRDGSGTRTRIMDAAQALILDHGFAATSVDAVVERAGVTKGAFFHHFESKTELAHALMERYAAGDAESLERTMQRAERLSRDPLQQLLLFVGLSAEAMDDMNGGPPPGCLFASYCYEAQLFDAHTHELIRRALLHWRERLAGKIREAEAAHPPRQGVDPDALADMLWVIFEGAFILSRTMKDPKAVAAQLRLYRSYLELLFGAG